MHIKLEAQVIIIIFDFEGDWEKNNLVITLFLQKSGTKSEILLIFHLIIITLQLRSKK